MDPESGLVTVAMTECRTVPSPGLPKPSTVSVRWSVWTRIVTQMFLQSRFLVDYRPWLDLRWGFSACLCYFHQSSSVSGGSG